MPREHNLHSYTSLPDLLISTGCRYIHKYVKNLNICNKNKTYISQCKETWQFKHPILFFLVICVIFQLNQFKLLILNAAWLAERSRISSLQTWGMFRMDICTRFSVLHSSMLTIQPSMRLVKYRSTDMKLI